ncbi:MAG: PAS domain S-box protein [Campylobacterota bacterium]|nr:PAS domain S-box protein [Campylobacterota bacterium]
MKNLRDPQNHDFLMNLLESYDKFVIVSETDLKGVITYVNDRFIKITGYTKSELMGQQHNIVRDPSNDPEIFKELWEHLKSGKVYYITSLSNKAKNGKIYYVEASFYPIFENGVKDCLRRDLTDRYKASNFIK